MYGTDVLFGRLIVCIGYFNSLNNALEMKARIRSVNDKITYAAEVCAAQEDEMTSADLL